MAVPILGLALKRTEQDRAPDIHDIGGDLQRDKCRATENAGVSDFCPLTPDS
jgi:hypothetical protein